MNSLETGSSPEQKKEEKEPEPISVEEFCEKLSSAKIHQSFGFGGVAAMLPHLLPDQLPEDWPNSEGRVYTIELDEMGNPKDLPSYGYYKDEDEYEYYDEVYPIPGVPGLVLIGNTSFVMFVEGKGVVPVVFKKDDGTAITLEVKPDGKVEEGKPIPLRWDEEQGKYIVGE